ACTACPGRLWRQQGNLLPFVLSLASDPLGIFATRSDCTLDRLLQPKWVQGRTTTDGLTKGLAEVTQAGVPHFQRCFRHIISSGLEQLGGPFHSEFSQKLGNGHSHLA